MRIGVLALQGAFAEHIAVLRLLKVDAPKVRQPNDLAGLDGLIIPGGESTTMCKLMESFDLTPSLRDLAHEGFPILGTCAGMIVLGKDADDPHLPTLGIMDIAVRRNAFGRQVASFEADIPITDLGETPYHAVFIRAPIIDSANDNVDLLARLPDGTPVAARQGNLLACAFHPELTQDPRLHRYFLEIAATA